MSQRLLLVDFTWTRDKDPRVPLGHASLLATLRVNTGIDVRSLVFPVNTRRAAPDEIAGEILGHVEGRSEGDVAIALGAYVWGEDVLRCVLAALRRRGFEGRIILGGPQISYCGPGLEEIYPEADAFVRGYGESALAGLAADPRRVDIPGVHWAGAKDRLVQATVDLASLPSPWLSGTIPLEGQRFVRWETQRGCPFRCAFCQHREPGARLRRRAMSWRRIAAEVDLFCRRQVQDIAVLDPIFNAVPHAVEVLERFASHGFSGRLSLQCRAEMVDRAFLDAAQRLKVRLEFGLQTIHPQEANAVRRRNHILKVDQVLEDVRRRGIDHEVSLIFGLPLQTVESFEESIRWCLDRRIPVIKAFPLLLLRGTALDLERGRWGFEDRGGAMPMVVRSSTFTRNEWRAMARLSEALALTEGRHPVRLEELRQLAADLETSNERWQPRIKEQAA